MKGRTVAGRSDPCAKPQAATAPSYWVCESTLGGLYFAIMQEGKVPMAYTGSAVGLVSVIGYMPDVFMGPLMGYLLDQSPGAAGHQHVFWLVSGFALLGLIASYLFACITRAAN